MRRLRLLAEGLKPEDLVLYKKDAPEPPPPKPLIAPAAPVEEAGVEIDDEKDKKKKTGKSSLKIPLAAAASTGLKA